MKILISDRLPQDVVKRLSSQKGVTIDVMPELGDPKNKNDLLSRLADYDGLIVRSATKVTKEVIGAAKKLKVIGRAGIGVDNIDLDEATRAGILVMNTPTGNVISTAEHTMAMILALARNIPQATAAMKQNQWPKKECVGIELFGKTLGIAGLGRVGRLVAERVKAFHMNIIAHDPFLGPEKAKELGVKPVSFEELLRKSDIITLHTSLTPDTVRLLDREEFPLMKKGVFIVNCSRGAVINEVALYEAIQEGRVAGAALDVFEEEPAKNNPLVSLPHVITTPHIAGSTRESEKNSAKTIVSQVVDFLVLGTITNAVNIVPIEIQNFERVKPYLELARTMGEIQTKLAGSIPEEVRVRYLGDVADMGTKFITQSILQGILSPFLGERVNVVNAVLLAGERGIKVSETVTKDVEDYQSIIELEFIRDKEKRVLSGTIFGKAQPTIVRIDDFRLEVSPSSRMLVFKNEDKPGVVGRVGTILGSHGINIADIRLSRVTKDKTAMAIMNVDSHVRQDVLNELASLPEIIEVKYIYSS